MCDNDDQNVCCIVIPGAQGAVGYQGNSAVRGYQGEIGFQSDVVVVGSQGLQGTVGFGITGSMGYIGRQGDSERGLDGAQGPQGFVNVAGPQGSFGERGVQGAQGLQQQGAQGPQGYQGFANQGAHGYQGRQGLSNPGPQGPAGPLSLLQITTFNGTQVVDPNASWTDLVPAATVGPGTYIVIFDGSTGITSAGAPVFSFSLPGSGCIQNVLSNSTILRLPVNLQSRITTLAGLTNIGPKITLASGTSPGNISVDYVVQILQFV